MESSKSARVVYPPGKAPFARTSRKPRNDDLSHGGEKHTRTKKKKNNAFVFCFSNNNNICPLSIHGTSLLCRFFSAKHSTSSVGYYYFRPFFFFLSLLFCFTTQRDRIHAYVYGDFNIMPSRHRRSSFV